MTKRIKKTTSYCGPFIDVLQTMRAELDEGAELLRAHYPNDSAKQLHIRTLALRQSFYARGGWAAAIAAKKAEEEEAAKKKAAADKTFAEAKAAANAAEAATAAA